MTSGTFADFIAAVAGPDDHVTLQRRARSATSAGARWLLIVARTDGTVIETTAATLADLTRRALSKTREHDARKERNRGPE